MAAMTPDQLRTRARVETLIRMISPGLNVVLAAGERLSRIVEPDDTEYYPVRAGAPESEVPGGAEQVER
jgi:hypothetical protein